MLYFLDFPKLFLFKIILVASVIQNVFKNNSFYIVLSIFSLFKLMFLFYRKFYQLEIYNFKNFYKDFFFIIFSLSLNFFLKIRISRFKENLKSDYSKITNYKFFYGKIFNKEIKDKKFFYKIKIRSKQLKTNSFILVVSNKDFSVGSIIFVKNFFWMNKVEKIDESFFENFFKTKILLIGFSNRIFSSEEDEDFFSIKIISFFENLKNKIISLCEKNFDKDENIFIKSIFLGKNDSANIDEYLKFRKWGIVHYLARSGLHANIITSLFSTFSLFFFFDFIKIQILSLCFLLFFYLVTFSSVSFQRAFFMYFLYFLCKIRGISTTPLHVFSFCTILFFLINPFYIYDIGFNLSFFASGILSILSYVNNFM